MNQNSKKVCVIGAGASGLAAVKCCLDEGLFPVCFESSGHIGGLWQYIPSKCERACVYKSTVINTSKEMMCFSDFPAPKSFPNFMHNTKVMEYFKLYAEKFDLHQYITFHTKVLSCQPTPDHSTTGKWIVEYQSMKNTSSSVMAMTFDGVLVCTGHHAHPSFDRSSFPGLDNYRGLYMHSHDYRTFKEYYDKNILVIGLGNSGGDIAVETSRVAKQVFLSTRRGAWVINRLSQKGLPIDIVYVRRYASLIAEKCLPNVLMPLKDTYTENLVCGRFDHSMYGLKPKHRFSGQHPLVNDDLPQTILNGSVKIMGNIKKITESGVVFEDGEAQDIDIIFFCTGYKFDFPFLDESIISVKDNKCDLYKHMWPTNLQKNTLAVIGLVQPFGAINPISEIQSRWATRVIKGIQNLPPQNIMMQDIKTKRSKMSERYYKSSRHTIQVDFIPYMDEIANEIGAVPDVITLIKTDFKLALHVLFGPATPYQYRLNGPGSCFESSRHNILCQMSNVLHPLGSTRLVEESRENYLALIVVFSLFVLLYCILLS